MFVSLSQHEAAVTGVEAMAATAIASIPLSSYTEEGGWGTLGMLEDTVFEPQDLTDLMDTLSHSDDTAESESIVDSVGSPTQQDNNSKKNTSGDVESPPTVNGAPKPSRKRRKHELDHLRSLASALESKLASLKKEGDDVGGTPGDGGGSTHFWKRISDQLLVDKQRAMGENARLREILRDQIKVVKSLQRSLAKSPDLNVRVQELFRDPFTMTLLVINTCRKIGCFVCFDRNSASSHPTAR